MNYPENDAKIIYARQPIYGDVRDSDRSIFLAGPTPRWPTHVPSWRPEAVRILREELKFDGWILVPEDRIGTMKDTEYKAQIVWEDMGLDASTVIAFWIPRSKDLPGYTTNVEFGMYLKSGKIVLGYPEDALKMKYLHYHAEENGILISHTLFDTLESAVVKLPGGLTPSRPV